VVNPADCITTSAEFELNSSLDCFCKAAGVAAWAGLLCAQLETKLAARATHKPVRILIFMD
jgi:hypothetical protein